MKFKENAIKPGMVIHCPTEEDARALLEHLDANGYDVPTLPEKYNHETDCFKLYDCGDNVKIVSYGTRQHYIQSAEKNTITEFSDLLIDDSPINSPADSPMSAVEVLSWLKDNKYTGACEEIFNTHNAGYVIDTRSPQEIIDKIAAYEAAKKEPKLKEVECGWHCHIYTEDKSKPDTIISMSDLPEYDLWGVTEDEALEDAKSKAKKFTVETGRTALAHVWFKCRVKEGES